MCAKLLERFVFPEFYTFRFSNRAHFVLPDLDKEIMAAMCIADVTVRSIRSRVNKKKKDVAR